MKKIRMISLLLALLTASSLMSCGSEGKAPESTDAGTTKTDEETTSEYTYPDENFDGYEFKFYSPDTQFGCYVRMDFEEQSGEQLDDAVYARNRRIEDRFNCKIREVQADASTWKTGQEDMCKTISQMVMSGDSDYDAAYLPVYFHPAVAIEGYLADLRTIPELDFEKPWWDNALNDEMEIAGKLYTASSALNFMSFDLSWVLLFNENMMEQQGITAPYDTVRDGKWTLDNFNTMLSGVASMNGDDSFKWNADGNAVYGIANHVTSPSPFLFSAGNRLMTHDGDGFRFTANTDRMFSTIDKLITLLDEKSGKAYSESTSGADFSKRDGYLFAFNYDRALFISCELKSALELRSMESNFGLVPMPKYDENQEDYITYVNPISCFLTIPTTNPDMKRTGIIIDALTYDSYKNCLPVYYDVTVSQKGLRNEDSIEMLQIVRNSRSTQVMNIYGVTTDLDNSLHQIIIKGQTNAASTIASAETKVEANLEKVLSAFGK